MNKLTKKLTVASMIAIAGALPASALTPLWMRDVKISPDGQTIAFTYRGDIWTVPAAGGEAKRITYTDGAYEDHPIWSPDGRTIAFSSDRTGNFDIFVVDAAGGTPTQLTFNSGNDIPEVFTADGQNIIYSASIQDQAKSAYFPTARMTELYSMPVKGGKSVQIAGLPMQMLSYSKANPDVIYYQDMKGHENEWRKHHTSSITRDIWKWNRKDNTFSNLTHRAGEDRNPVISADGKTLYFLREEPGKSINVYKMSPEANATAQQMTSFTNHPVRFLSSSNQGKLCFTYDGEIYTMTDGGTPEKVAVNLLVDDISPDKVIDVKSIDDAAASPDGKSIAFISRGDVFVTSVEYPSVKQITKTPQAERQISWSPDGKKLLYTSERDGHWNIYTARKARSEEPNFENATIIIEEPLFDPSDKVERTYASYSPDGNNLAYIKDRNKLVVKDLTTGKEKQLLDGHTHLSRGGGYHYQWSPDGKWILTQGILHRHDPYSDVFIVSTDDGTLIPLTETGYFDSDPKFALDGNAVIYQSDRYGMRNHASWGSLTDVMMVFLNEEAYDKFTLSEEDYALKKEAEKSNKSGSDEKSKKVDDVKLIQVEPRNIQDRTVRLTPASGNVSDAFVTADGDNLYYMGQYSKGYDLWKKNLRTGKSEEVKKVGSDPAQFIADKDGKTVFMVSRNAIRKMDKGDKLTDVKYATKATINPGAERDYMYDYVKRQEREMFYDTAMHGVDWEYLTEHYRKFLPHISNNYDFAVMLSELLGELNVSHTGGRYSAPANPNGHRTASLGLLFDMTDPGDGMIVTEVIEGGAFDKSWSNLRAGDKVVAINGQDITATSDMSKLLADAAGKKTLVKYRKPSGQVVEEVIIPDSKGKEGTLLYNRWVKQRAADVEKWSNGRLGYVHIQSMGDPSFRDIYADVLGKYNEKEGIVIDIRWNGGGRLHEDIEVLFSGDKYFTQVVRGHEACDMPSRRWNKPSIMVQSEACYSNAHGTPWVYKHRGLGKLVGAPVPGTMTSVNWVRMQDPTMVFGIPVTGYLLPEGNYLENTQLEPDVYVLNAPEDVMNGTDTQLKVAVETLLKDIDAKK